MLLEGSALTSLCDSVHPIYQKINYSEKFKLNLLFIIIKEKFLIRRDLSDIEFPFCYLLSSQLFSVFPVGKYSVSGFQISYCTSPMHFPFLEKPFKINVLITVYSNSILQSIPIFPEIKSSILPLKLTSIRKLIIREATNVFISITELHFSQTLPFVIFKISHIISSILPNL